MSNGNNKKINCLRCKHYVVTWDPKAPRACKLLGFKASTMPSAVAYSITGKVCEGFEKKDIRRVRR